jgi:hypothetical protein
MYLRTSPEYLAAEFAAHQSALLLADPVAGLDIISLSFGAPEIVPVAALRDFRCNRPYRGD